LGRALEARAKNIDPETTSATEAQETLESDPESTSVGVDIPDSDPTGNAK